MAESSHKSSKQKRWGRVYSLSINYKDRRLVLEEFTCDDRNYTKVSEKPLENLEECLECMKQIYDFDIMGDEKLSVILAKFDQKLDDFWLFCIFMDHMIIKLASQDSRVFPSQAVRAIHGSMTKKNIDLMSSIPTADEKLISPEHLILSCQISVGTKGQPIVGLRSKLKDLKKHIEESDESVKVCWATVFPDKVQSMEEEVEFVRQMTSMSDEEKKQCAADKKKLLELVYKREGHVMAQDELARDLGRVMVRVVHIKPPLLSKIQQVSEIVNVQKFYQQKISDPIYAELCIPPRYLELIRQPDDLVETYKTLSWYQSLFSSSLDDIMPLIDQVLRTRPTCK